MTSELSAHSPLPVQKAKMSPGKLPLSLLPTHTPTCNNYHIFHALGSALISLVGLEFPKHKDFICVCFFFFFSFLYLPLRNRHWFQPPRWAWRLSQGALAKTLLPGKQRWLGHHCGFSHSTVMLSPLPPKTHKAPMPRGEQSPLQNFFPRPLATVEGGNCALMILPIAIRRGMGPNTGPC